MKRLICATVAALLVGTTIGAAPSQGKSRKHARAEHAKSKDVSTTPVRVHVAFGTADVAIIREHYAPRYRNLPPGLQKKVARGGKLPPGWQKKFEPFPVVLERRLQPLPPGYRRGVVDGHAVIYNARTNVIVDVAMLF
jgi:hypothetical protein